MYKINAFYSLEINNFNQIYFFDNTVSFEVSINEIIFL